MKRYVSQRTFRKKRAILAARTPEEVRVSRIREGANRSRARRARRLYHGM